MTSDPTGCAICLGPKARQVGSWFKRPSRGASGQEASLGRKKTVLRALGLRAEHLRPQLPWDPESGQALQSHDC